MDAQNLTDLTAANVIIAAFLAGIADGTSVEHLLLKAAELSAVHTTIAAIIVAES
jgi:hypothetical protein